MSWFSRGSSFVSTSQSYALVHFESGQIGENYQEHKVTRDSQSVTWNIRINCSITANTRVAKLPDATQKEAEPEYKLASTGSGFVVDEKGHVLTNHHVIDDCSEVRVRLGLPGSQASAVVAKDAQNDLALIRSDLDTESIALFREGRSIRPGDSVVALGFPLRGLLSSQPSVTTGTVSALAGIRDDIRFLQITAPVQPGNSGGPLLDSSGNIVGIVVGKLDAVKVAELLGDIPQNVNFAIKGSVARSFLDANAVDYETDQSTTRLEAADIAERAREFTVLVECWN